MLGAVRQRLGIIRLHNNYTEPLPDGSEHAKARYNSSPQQFRALAPDAISLTGLSRERQWGNEASLPRPNQSSPKTFELAYCGEYLDKPQPGVRCGRGSDPFAAACVTA